MTPEPEYPWTRCALGESFFVPSLNVRWTQIEGLRIGHELLGQKADLTARIGVHQRVLGVLFSVRSFAPPGRDTASR